MIRKADISELMFPENPSVEEITLISELAQGMKVYFPGFVHNEFELLLKEKIKKTKLLLFGIKEKLQGVFCFLIPKEK